MTKKVVALSAAVLDLFKILYGGESFPPVNGGLNGSL